MKYMWMTIMMMVKMMKTAVFHGSMLQLALAFEIASLLLPLVINTRFSLRAPAAIIYVFSC